MKQQALFDLLSKWIEECGDDTDLDVERQLRELEAEPVRFRDIDETR
jgi:hypothetical protein